MKNRLLLQVLLFISVLLCSCAEPERDSEDGSNPLEVNQSDSIMQEPDGLSDLKESRKHITVTYGTDEYSLNIDADVMVSDSIVQKGILMLKNLDLSLIEKYLCDGEVLHQKPSQESDLFFVSDSNEVENDIEFDKLFYYLTDVPGYASFSNYQLDKYFNGQDSTIKTRLNRSEEENIFVDTMESNTLELLEHLGLNVMLSSTIFETTNISNRCFVSANTLLDGYSLISNDNHIYCTNEVNISDYGINSVSFNGLFDIKVAEPVKVLNLDDILDIVKRGVEEKNINTYIQTIRCIRLAYMVDTSGEEYIFYPVWTFDISYSDESGLEPFICLDAQNGEVIYMK